LAAVIGSLIMGFALLFSLSRAGWASAIVGVGVALMCANRAAREMSASRTIAKFRISSALLIPIAIAASVAIMLFFAGSRGREAIAARLNPAPNSMYYRPTLWRDTLKLIGDFPLFGVGLGCWPELFPHYRRPPWSPFFFREAENDYLQLIAEIGLLGAVLVSWLGIRLVRGFSRDAHEAPDRYWALLPGLIGGATAMLVHEAFDFSLRTPGYS